MSDTTELVDLAVIFPDLEIELKYACADNITGKAIYQQARCLLHKDAIMTGGGFVGISSEWWHFELPQAASYPLLADQFSCFISPGTQHVS
ncbi:hypothetical protein LAY53_21450 [Escherichia coli]|nr:hypothetical protein [Escherichia coli]